MAGMLDRTLTLVPRVNFMLLHEIWSLAFSASLEHCPLSIKKGFWCFSFRLRGSRIFDGFCHPPVNTRSPLNAWFALYTVKSSLGQLDKAVAKALFVRCHTVHIFILHAFIHMCESRDCVAHRQGTIRRARAVFFSTRERRRVQIARAIRKRHF